MSEFSPTTTHQDIDEDSWHRLTAGQQRVAKAVAFLSGPGVFDRPTLQEDAESSYVISAIVDDKDRLLTSLSYTNLLNKLTDLGYLTKISQGGQNPVVFDTNPQEDQSVQSAPFGSTGQLMRLAEAVIQREGLSDRLLEEVDASDFNEVIKQVNEAAGYRALAITADPSRYGITVRACQNIVENSLPDVEVLSLDIRLFNQYETLDYSLSNTMLEATIESIDEGVVRFVITDDEEYLDEAYVQHEDYEELTVNDAFSVIYLTDEQVYLLYDIERSEEVKEEVREIIVEYQQQVVPVEEWQE